MKQTKSKKQKVKNVKSDSDLIIQFVGKRRSFDKKTGKRILVPAEAPTMRKNGQRVFLLPPDEEQRAGFTHPDAAALLTLYPKEFKKKVTKGK